MRATIVQDYIASYRSGFYRELQTQSARRGWAIDVVVGATSEGQAARDDAGTTIAASIRHREFKVAGRRLAFRDLREVISSSDVIVLEQARRNLDTYRLFIPRRKAKIALWGHGRDFVKSTVWFERVIWNALTRRADHLLMYTQEGADYAIGIGVHPDKITVLNNSTDTRELSAQLAEVTPEARREYKEQVAGGRDYVLYVGGLDRDKGVSALSAVAKALAQSDLDVSLVVAGEGNSRQELEETATQVSTMKLVGRIEGREKALALAGARMLVIPGRVGLVAVDSIASGVPVVTRAAARHAPEYSYLTPGESVIAVLGNERQYAEHVVALLQQEELLTGMQSKLAALRPLFGVEAMASRFIDGLHRAGGSSS